MAINVTTSEQNVQCVFKMCERLYYINLKELIDGPLIKGTKRPTLEATLTSVCTLVFFLFNSEWSQWQHRRLRSSSLINISARHQAAYQ